MDLNFLPASEIQKSTGPRQAQGSILKSQNTGEQHGRTVS